VAFLNPHHESDAFVQSVWSHGTKMGGREQTIWTVLVVYALWLLCTTRTKGHGCIRSS
jgi:hypothetical protein